MYIYKKKKKKKKKNTQMYDQVGILFLIQLIMLLRCHMHAVYWRL